MSIPSNSQEKEVYLQKARNQYHRYKKNHRDKILKWSRDGRRRNKEKINQKQQNRRKNDEYRWYDKLVCDSRRTIGISPTKLTKQDMKVLLYVRLFKLVKGQTISMKSAQKIINNFESNAFEVLLSIYQYRVTPNILGINQLNKELR